MVPIFQFPKKKDSYFLNIMIYISQKAWYMYITINQCFVISWCCLLLPSSTLLKLSLLADSLPNTALSLSSDEKAEKTFLLWQKINFRQKVHFQPAKSVRCEERYQLRETQMNWENRNTLTICTNNQVCHENIREKKLACRGGTHNFAKPGHFGGVCTTNVWLSNIQRTDRNSDSVRRT